jgi:hypothetical protein
LEIKIQQLKEELDRFLASEEYLDTLKDSFNSRSCRTSSTYLIVQEAAKNYSSLAENFAGFTNLKGAHIDQLAVLAKDISIAF